MIQSKEHSHSSQKSISLDPEQRFQQIVSGHVGIEDVTLAEWVQLVTMRMAEGVDSHLNVIVPYGGGIYDFHHCIEMINPPESTKSILEQKQ